MKTLGSEDLFWLKVSGVPGRNLGGAEYLFSSDQEAGVKLTPLGFLFLSYLVPSSPNLLDGTSYIAIMFSVSV